MGIQAGRNTAGGAPPGQLFHPDRVIQVIASLAAVFGRELEAEEAELTAPFVELPRELPGLFPLVDPRRYFVLDEAADRFTQLGVMFGEGRGEGTRFHSSGE